TVTMNQNATPPVITPAGASRTVANAVTLNSGFTALNSSALSLDLTGPMTMPGSTQTRIITNNLMSGSTLTLGSGTAPSTITLAGTLFLQTTLPAGTGGNTVINDLIQDNGTTSGALTAQGNVFVQLTNVNTYTGNTTITSGATVSISSPGALGAASNSLILGGGTLKATANMDLNKPVTLNGAGGTINTDPVTVTMSGVISGSGDLTASAGGTLVLTANNTYSGTTHINGAGTVLSVGSSANLGDASPTNGVAMDGGTLQTTGPLS